MSDCHVSRSLAAFAVAVTLLTSARVHAVDCEQPIASLQTQGDGELLVYFRASWHLVAAPDSPAAKDWHALLLAALLSVRTSVLTYPDGYDCEATNYDTPALAVVLK
jgi:hypothetical protein